MAGKRQHSAIRDRTLYHVHEVLEAMNQVVEMRADETMQVQGTPETLPAGASPASGGDTSGSDGAGTAGAAREMTAFPDTAKTHVMNYRNYFAS